MCGRYCISDDTAREIEKIVRNLDRKLAVHHSGDVSPSAMATVLVQPGNLLTATDMKWGFPGYEGKSLLINARAESVLGKRTFQESVRQRRCVVPASGFYEWNRKKEKFTFRRADHVPLLFMAGCYNLYDGKNRFVILTTQANASMAPVHERMPLILERSEMESWLTDDGCVERLLKKEPSNLVYSTEYEQLSLFEINNGV